MTLICIPYAGGNKHSYRNLRRLIDKEISVNTLELPGRGSRSTESLISDLNDMAEDVYQQILKYTVTDYMIFGHSMGAMLGDLVIHKLEERGKNLPIHFLITGCPSPKRRGLRKKLSELTDQDFKKALNLLGGMPNQVLGNHELANYIMPVLRNDISAIDNDVYTKSRKYNVPLTIFSGTNESLVEEDMVTWQLETSVPIHYQYLEGGHFFINKHLNFIANFINNVFLQKKHKTMENSTIRK
jgi:surfactin synthase thioesterase subunit